MFILCQYIVYLLAQKKSHFTYIMNNLSNYIWCNNHQTQHYKEDNKLQLDFYVSANESSQLYHTLYIIFHLCTFCSIYFLIFLDKMSKLNPSIKNLYLLKSLLMFLFWKEQQVQILIIILLTNLQDLQMIYYFLRSK